MRAGDLPPGTAPWSGTPDPDALVLLFASKAQQCAAPWFNGTLQPPPCTAPGWWQAALLVPPDLDRPGPVDLSDPWIAWAATEVFANCQGGGQEVSQGRVGGTLDILSSDPGSLSVELSGGVNAVTFATVIDGAYTVQRCDAAPPAAAPTPAIAILGANLPAVDGGVDGGATPDPTALYVILGAPLATCQDPLPNIDCQNTWRMVFSLPASLQHPGTIELTDPAIAATAARSGDPASPPCATLRAPFTPGTVQIDSIDATGISFSVYQAHFPHPGIDADGLYAASICP
jgi:hypothetical protein